jgi:uncharacterized RDD family membrane protein YckC
VSSMPPPPPPPPAPPPVPGPGTGPVAPNGAPLASGGMRILARLIEFVGYFVLTIVLSTIVHSFVASLVAWVVGWALEAYLTATKGGSVGKLILGLRVVNAADGSSPVSLQTATIRWAIPSASYPVPILGFLGSFVVWVVSLVLLFSDANRQTVSDKVAKTLVVTTK